MPKEQSPIAELAEKFGFVPNDAKAIKGMIMNSDMLTM